MRWRSDSIHVEGLTEVWDSTRRLFNTLFQAVWISSLPIGEAIFASAQVRHLCAAAKAEVLSSKPFPDPERTDSLDAGVNENL